MKLIISTKIYFLATFKEQDYLAKRFGRQLLLFDARYIKNTRRVRKIMRKYDKKWLDRFAVRKNGDRAENRLVAI